MYEKLYGFKERPFSMLPDPSFLYLGEKHSAAFALLEYGLMSKAGFTVITGEVGSGKTTLVRHLLNQTHDDVTVGLISNTHEDMGHLLKWVLLAFNQKYDYDCQVALYDAFRRFLIDQYAKYRHSVLIIDEAQNLQPKVLEELRMLSNINADKHLVLQLILVGQPQLREQLNSPDLLQFRQRISVRYHLPALSEDDTLAYIRHRIRCAGCENELFTKGAIDIIYQASEGIPRAINLLCDTALVYGYAKKRPSIDAEIIQAVLADIEESISPQRQNMAIDQQAADAKEAVTLPSSESVPKVCKLTEFDKDAARQLFGNTLKKY